MTPLTEALAELRLWVDHVESIAESLRATPGTGVSAWQDHRTEAIADLWDTLERIEPGLGNRAIQALYPRMAPAEEAQGRRS